MKFPFFAVAWALAAALTVGCGGGSSGSKKDKKADGSAKDGKGLSDLPLPPSDPPAPVGSPTKMEPLKYPEAAKALNDAAGAKVEQLRTTPTGLQYHVLVEGDGVVLRSGMVAKMHYTGWLVDGRKFDSSRDRNETFPVALGARRVIAGWEEGLLGMKMGGRRILVIPPELGYGPRGSSGTIPPNAVLVFDVEALK